MNKDIIRKQMLLKRKEIIRKQMLLKRKEINNKEKISTIIVDKIINLDIYKKSRVVALYNSLSNEVDTNVLINKSLKNKIVLLPRIINDKIEFIRIDNNTKYEKSNIGVMEPIGKEYLGNIDLIVVPGVSFDRERNRLGFGMGYYDKYLNNKNIYKIGICFNEQLISELPVNKFDIKMDLIITEKELI